MFCYLTMAANAIPHRHETFHQHPKNIPIAIHCPRNKWLISCKELLPKISTCFIHAVLLPPKLPTVETKKNKLHETNRNEISMIHKQASLQVCLHDLSVIAKLKPCQLRARLSSVPLVEVFWDVHLLNGSVEQLSDGVREPKAKHQCRCIIIKILKNRLVVIGVTILAILALCKANIYGTWFWASDSLVWFPRSQQNLSWLIRTQADHWLFDVFCLHELGGMRSMSPILFPGNNQDGSWLCCLRDISYHRNIVYKIYIYSWQDC